MLKSWCRIFRGSHLIEATLLPSIIGRLNYIVSSGLESRLWFDLYLGRDIKK